MAETANKMGTCPKDSNPHERCLNQDWIPLPPTAAEPSEPKADGFDETWEGICSRLLAQYETRTDPPEFYKAVAHVAYQAGEQSGVRKGMRRALEAVRKLGDKEVDS